MGIERLREALETNDWESNELSEGIAPENLDEEDEGGEGSIGFSKEAAEMEMEMFGMKQAIYGGSNDEEIGEDEGQDEDVEQLQAMMLKMQAVRGTCS